MKCPSCRSEEIREMGRVETGMCEKCLTCGLFFVVDIKRKEYKESSKKTLKKPVGQYKEGKLVNRYESISEASRENEIAYTAVWNACNGKQKTSGGYEWKLLHGRKST